MSKIKIIEDTSCCHSLSDDVLNELEQVCIARYERKFYIHNNNFIDYKSLLKIRSIINKTSQTIVFSYIESGRPRRPVTDYSFVIEEKCTTCGNLVKVEVGKSKLLEIISENEKVECYNCKQLKIKQQQEYNQNSCKINEQKTKQYTQNFIDTYCNPNCSWKDEVPLKDYFKSLQAADNYYVDDNKVKKYFNSISYRDFLQTPYWKAIAQQKKFKSKFMCELCGSHNTLNVHHKTYIHHGEEIRHLDDLIVLCSDCHAKFHNKLETEK